MGLLGNLITGAQEAFNEKREEARAAAEEKSRRQDEGWAYQLRLKRDYTGAWNSARSEVIRIRDRNRQELYKAEAGLYSPKRRTIIKDIAKNKIASMKAVRFKGIGIEAAIDIKIGEQPVGRVLKRKAGMLNGYDHDYHFDPIGLTLSYEGGFKNFHYKIRNSHGEVEATIYHCGMFDEDWFKVNFNNETNGLLYVIMLLAMEDIDEKAWED